MCRVIFVFPHHGILFTSSLILELALGVVGYGARHRAFLNPETKVTALAMPQVERAHMANLGVDFGQFLIRF